METVNLRIYKKDYDLIKKRAEKDNTTMIRAVNKMITGNNNLDFINEHIESVIDMAIKKVEEKKKEEMFGYMEYLEEEANEKVKKIEEYVTRQLHDGEVTEDEIMEKIEEMKKKYKLGKYRYGF